MLAWNLQYESKPIVELLYLSIGFDVTDKFRKFTKLHMLSGILEENA
jgi:hypothetical protein